MLRAAGDLAPDMMRGKQRPDLRHGLLHESETLGAARVEVPHDLLIDLRARKAERQVLELPLHLPDTEAVRKR